MKKRIAVIMVILCVVVLLAGCGKEEKNNAEREIIDMTHMSGNVIYGEVFAMMMEPQEYEGKTICIKGLFNMQKDKETGQDYYFVLITDAQACCQQGIELKGKDDAPPRGLPAIGGEMVVEGKFGKYEMNGREYYCIFVEKIFSPVE